MLLNHAEFLFKHRGNNTDPLWLADVLGHLVWLTEDNGHLIHQTLESWLVSGDLERAKVALAYDETVLFADVPDAKRVYSALSARFPELQAACDNALIRSASIRPGA